MQERLLGSWCLVEGKLKGTDLLKRLLEIGAVERGGSIQERLVWEWRLVEGGAWANRSVWAEGSRL